MFAHLHTHTGFSFLFGTYLPETLVERARQAGHPAVAITDKNGVYGAVRATLAAREHGVRLVVGSEITLWDGTSLILLARDATGYNNLCHLAGAARRNRGAHGPACPEEEFSRRARGLVCLTGGRNGRLRRLVSRNRTGEAMAWLAHLLRLFGRDDLFVELQNQGLEGDLDHVRTMARLARAAGLPVVATNAVVYLDPPDKKVHEVLVGVQTAVHHRDVRPVPPGAYHFRTEDEMRLAVPFPEALENTARIVARCRFSLPVGEDHPPHLDTRDAPDPDRVLARTCLVEMARRGTPVTLPYLRRLEKELDAIKRRNLSAYFLLVKDIRDHAARSRIRHTVRGSAAGSLVLRLLAGGVDPVAHDLLFERFLNDERADMPDVDIDFDSLRRDEVIQYVMDRYAGRAAMVATVPTFRARGAIRALGRSLGYSFEELDRLCAYMPYFVRANAIRDALEKLPELAGSPLVDEPELLDLAEKVSGLPRQLSVHLGGVVITPGEIEDWSPHEISRKGFPVIQFDKDDVEALGLIKLDLLGLRMHTALQKGLDVLKKQGVRLRLEDAPLDDEPTYRLLRTTDSVGMFQVESPGQRQLLGRLQPKNFEDIIAQISLFRPGPMEGDMLHPYVARRRGVEPVSFPHPALEPVLSSTYGVILFQEQILEIGHRIAGFSYGKADLLRRALGNTKRRELLNGMERDFITGCEENGFDRKSARAIFDMVAGFAGYGFCRAHAASFAHITYQSAYMKAHHPLAFFIGLLNAGHVGSYPASVFLNEAARMGFPTLPVHVNASGLEYLEENNGIRVPLTVVYGVGQRFGQRIVDSRGDKPYKSIPEFVARTRLPANVVSRLRNAGAFSGLWGAPADVLPMRRGPAYRTVTSPGVAPHAGGAQ
ncbi:MAG: DNA polymerase III subunit alpha [Desulfatibacillaceae bacterium]